MANKMTSNLPPPLLEGIIDELNEKVVDAGGHSTDDLEYWQNVTGPVIPGMIGADFDSFDELNRKNYPNH